MVDKDKQAEELMNEVVKRINESAEAMEGWGKAFQMFFTDINTGYWVKVAMDGHVEKFEKGMKDRKESAAVISIDVDTFGGILNKTTGAQEAMNKGKIKIDGGLAELIKLNLIFS